MVNNKLKSAISRIMSDLIKLDDLITASELEFLGAVFKKYGVTDQDRKMGFYMTLAEAIDILSNQPQKFCREFYALMEEESRADGLCSRPEALLLMAFACSCRLSDNGVGRVFSFESKGMPIHRDQLIYVSREDRTDYSPLSDSELYDDISNISRLAGFELVYVPRIAQHFNTYGDTEILRKVLRLVRPTLDRSEDEIIRQLRAMTPYKFYTNILERKMKMSLDLSNSPCWLLKLKGSQVAGTEYSNFFLLTIDRDHMKKQLQSFVSELLRMQSEQIFTVPNIEGDANNFRYGGFIRSILDMISMGTDDRWDIVIRLRGCKDFHDGDNKEQKAAITIRRGDEEWPLIVPDRDAAFYVLVLCATAENPSGIFMHKELERRCRSCLQYEEIYRCLSVRDESDCPDISFSETRRPIKSRITKLIQNHDYLTEKDLYQLSSSQHRLFVVLNPSNIIVRYKNMNAVVEKTLKESSLFSSVSKIR